MSSQQAGDAGSKLQSAKTLLLTGHGGYDKLVVVSQERQPPGKGQVMVNMKANGINFAELMARQGTYQPAPKTPTVLGFEGAGDIVAVGPDVTDKKVGDRVIALCGTGSWTEYINVPAERCFKMPEGMTYEEGAAIPVNYITAYHMLFNMSHLSKGQSVLVHMVAGGVGFAATQLCRTVPDVTVFGTCSAAKHQVVKGNGVNHPIDYRSQDYVEEIRKISPKGVDIVLDPLNGADADKGYNLLKPFGTIIHFGAANLVTGEQRSLWQMAKTWWGVKNYSSLSVITHNKTRGGYHLGFLVNNPELTVDAVENLLKMYTEGKIKPQIDSVWAYEDVGSAMGRMHERKNIGKVILSPQKKSGEGEVRARTG